MLIVSQEIVNYNVVWGYPKRALMRLDQTTQAEVLLDDDVCRGC